jgi:hypothetical protein
MKDSDDLKDEYKFDYSKAKSNRFAPEGGRVVILEPDVAKVFTSNETVNRVLRALLETMPAQR